MIAESLLSLTLLLAAPPQPEPNAPDAPHRVPTVTLADLNAFVRAENYHRIRIEKLGLLLEATGKVEALAAYDGLPVVDLPGFLHAGLQGLPKDHGLAVGDRVRFRGMIVSEGYACLQVWTYDVEKLPPVSEKEAEPEAAAPADSAPAAPSPASLAKSSEELLPKVNADDLDAAKEKGDYLDVRKEMIGRRLFADAVVEQVGAWPLVRLSENWHAHLHSHSSDWRLKAGDRVRFHGLIVDEAYSAVTVWVERIEKLPAEEAPAK